jgi:hypothetical protein
MTKQKTNKKVKEISFSGQMKPLIDKRLDKVFDAQDKRKMRKK